MKRSKKKMGRMPIEMALCSQRNRVFKGLVEVKERARNKEFRREARLYR